MQRYVEAAQALKQQGRLRKLWNPLGFTHFAHLPSLVLLWSSWPGCCVLPEPAACLVPLLVKICRQDADQ